VGEDPKTEEMRIAQARRETLERHGAEEAVSEDAAEQHRRRAEKASYLRRKLEERADAERRSSS
jgi:hypothetical protein